MTSRLPLLWNTWSRARGSATCAGLAYGRDYSFWLSEQKWKKVLCHCTWKTAAHGEAFSTLTPQPVRSNAFVCTFCACLLSYSRGRHIQAQICIYCEFWAFWLDLYAYICIQSQDACSCICCIHIWASFFFLCFVQCWNLILASSPLPGPIGARILS